MTAPARPVETEAADLVAALFDAGAIHAKVKLRRDGATYEIEASRDAGQPRKEIGSGRKRRA